MFTKLRMLPINVLRSIIQTYNAHIEKNNVKAKKLNFDDTLGLKFLSEKNQFFVKNLIYQMDNAPLIFLDLKQNSENYKNKFIQAVQTLNKKQVKHLAQSYAGEQHEYKLQMWRLKQQKLLSQNGIWSNLELAAKTATQRFQVRQLHAKWNKHSHYVHYNADALLNVFEIVIPALENYLVYAQSELKSAQKKIPTTIFKNTLQYLEELVQEVQEEKEQIKESILARLTMATGEQDLSQGDLIARFAKKLKEDALLKENFQLPKKLKHDMTPAIFGKFKNIIEKEGTAAQKKSLLQLSYHQKNEKSDSLINETDTVMHENKIWIVPEELKNKMPKIKPWVLRLPRPLRGLFKETAILSEFIKHPNCQFLLASASLINKPDLNIKIELLDLENVSALSGMNNVNYYIQSELIRIQMVQKNLNSTLHKKAIHFIENYKKILDETGKKMVFFKTDILASLLSCLEGKSGKGKTCVITDEEKNILKNFIEELEKNTKDYGCKEIEMQDMISRAKRFLNPLIVEAVNKEVIDEKQPQNKVLVKIKEEIQKKSEEVQSVKMKYLLEEQALGVVEKLYNGHLPDRDGLIGLLDALSLLPKQEKNYVNQNIMLYFSMSLKKLPTRLIGEFLKKPLVMEVSELKHHLQNITTMVSLLQYDNNSILAERSIKDAIYQYYQKFLIDVLNLGSNVELDKKLKNIVEIEDTLLLVADDYIRTSIKEIRKCRENNYPWAVFAILKLKVEIGALNGYFQEIISPLDNDEILKTENVSISI